jgi:class 3 adenylate cyclase/tetratricopeptide (TPR) repeat protein
MQCPQCQFENVDGAKFCNECGGKLEVNCSECGKPNPPGSKFCNECGYDLTKPAEAHPIDYSEPQSYTPKHLTEKILNTRSSIEGERKLVTVLFADVANYTSMSEKLDPEEVHQIMDGCFKILMDEIHRYEGTINQFTGDGVMALFGAPVSHEDHAQRACYAALSIQKAMDKYGTEVKKNAGVDFEMRIGLNTGKVIVGAIGEDLRMDYTAVGDTTNLAARIQQTAQPGKVWLSRNTQNIISGFFQIESVGDHELKGIAEKQSIFKLLAEHKEVRTRFEAGLARGITGLVGRRPEMKILREAWERARSGEARLVDIVGEAGVGKSRLIYEFQKAIDDEATFLTGVCIHYGRNINFLPVIDIVRSAFNIEEGMSEEEAGRRIQEKSTSELGKMIPFYRNLLSLKIDDEGFNSLNPEGRKFGTFEAVKQLLWSVSESKPLVVFIEDVHWIDKISEEFFVFFSHSIQSKKILMLSAYRPEGAPGWAKGPYYRHLGVEPLSAKSSGHLVRNILGGVDLDPELEKMIVARTGGNPFFVEEMVRELMERNELIKDGKCYVLRNPIDRLDIPGTVQGIIAARMDRLSEDLKKTMQVASVIGRDFAYKILRSILELGDELRAHLTNLVGLEVLYEKALYPELEYIFKHALTQEVAYESLLKQRRREIHGRIASTIEELYASNLEPHYELLAHHWELSNDSQRAVEYLMLAGDKSNRNQAGAAAVDFFSRALDLIESSDGTADPEILIHIRAGRADPLHMMGKIEESLADYKEAIRLAREEGNNQLALDCLTRLPNLIYNTTLKDEIPDICNEGIELAKTMKDKGAEASILAMYSYYNYLWGMSNEFDGMYTAFEMAKKLNNPGAIIHTQVLLTVVERWVGRSKNSVERTEGFIEMLHSQFNIFLASQIPFGRGMAFTEIGKYKEAVNLFNQWVDIAEQNSLFMTLSRYLNCLAWVYSEIYEFDKAFDLNKRALENAVYLKKSPALVYSASEMRSNAEVNLMENKFETGDVDGAWMHIEQYEEKSTHPDYILLRDRWLSRMNLLKGKILCDRGEIESAEQIAQNCLEAAIQYKWLKYVGRAERLFGEVLIRKKAYDQAEDRLKSALERFKEVGNPKQLWITYTTLARLYETINRSDLEREQWQKAKKTIMETAEGLQGNKLKETFISASPVKQILGNAKP